MININAILIKSLKSKSLNFKKLLINKDTIIWRNCNNLNIKVTSKINKFQEKQKPSWKPLQQHDFGLCL